MKEGDEKERRTERGKGKMRASGYCGDGFVKREWALERECAKRKKKYLTLNTSSGKYEKNQTPTEELMYSPVAS